MPASDEERGAQAEAVEFLRDLLADGPVASNDVKRQSREAGISERTLWRAKSQIGVIATKQGMEGGWTWELPKSAKDARSMPMSENGSLRETWQPSGNGQRTNRRCPNCNRPYQVTDSDRPGWVRISCGCDGGAQSWAHADDPALIGGAG